MAELYNPNSLPADFVKVYGGTEDSVKIFLHRQESIL